MGRCDGRVLENGVGLAGIQRVCEGQLCNGAGKMTLPNKLTVAPGVSKTRGQDSVTRGAARGSGARYLFRIRCFDWGLDYMSRRNGVF